MFLSLNCIVKQGKQLMYTVILVQEMQGALLRDVTRYNSICKQTVEDCVSLGGVALGKLHCAWGREESKGSSWCGEASGRRAGGLSQKPALTTTHVSEGDFGSGLWLSPQTSHRREKLSSLCPPDQRATAIPHCEVRPVCCMVTESGTLDILRETRWKLPFKTMSEETTSSTPFLCFLLSSTFNHKCCSEAPECNTPELYDSHCISTQNPATGHIATVVIWTGGSVNY